MDVDALVARYEAIAAERMQGLPIVNPRLEVEAVGFFDFGEHRFGVLIAPWFMNMVLLPGSDEYAELQQGDKVTLSLPSGDYEFTACRDAGDAAAAGVYLSAVLFRTVTDFPNQSTARAVATEVLVRLFDAPSEIPAGHDGVPAPRRVSRRGLLSGRSGA